MKEKNYDDKTKKRTTPRKYDHEGHLFLENTLIRIFGKFVLLRKEIKRDPKKVIFEDNHS
jgi:hypothetical protein